MVVGGAQDAAEAQPVDGCLGRASLLDEAAHEGLALEDVLARARRLGRDGSPDAGVQAREERVEQAIAVVEVGLLLRHGTFHR